MDSFDMSKILLKKSSVEKSVSESNTETKQIMGTATSDSSDGTVMVDMSGDTVSQDGTQSVKMQTTVAVKEGDIVNILLTGHSPLVIGVVGRGDEQNSEIASAVSTATEASTTASTAQSTAQSASTAASAAQSTAQSASTTADTAKSTADSAKSTADSAATAASTAQSTATAAQNAAIAIANYFFHDSDGAHVATTEGDATTGFNALLTATKLAFRNALEELLTIDASTNSISLGKNSDSATIDLCNAKGKVAYNARTATSKCVTLESDSSGVMLYACKPGYTGEGTNGVGYVGLNQSSDSSGDIILRMQFDELTMLDFNCSFSDYANAMAHVCTREILYNNESTAVNAGITLSETAANFTDMEIFYKSNDDYFGSVKVHSPDGKKVSLVSFSPQGAELNGYLKGRVVSISGTSINTAQNASSAYCIGEANLINGASVTFTGTDVIAITRVVGWRY